MPEPNTPLPGLVIDRVAGSHPPYSHRSTIRLWQGENVVGDIEVLDTGDEFFIGDQLEVSFAHRDDPCEYCGTRPSHLAREADPGQGDL